MKKMNKMKKETPRKAQMGILGEMNVGKEEGS
jgi:hypothetical protein